MFHGLLIKFKLKKKIIKIKLPRVYPIRIEQHIYSGEYPLNWNLLMSFQDLKLLLNIVVRF